MADVEELYREALLWNAEVPTRKASYDEATTNRARIVAALRAEGQSVGKIAGRLGVAKSRVDQLLLRFEQQKRHPAKEAQRAVLREQDPTRGATSRRRAAQ